MPVFSVIVATYNRADLLAEALESVFAQEFPDFELIVVDDGSTDDTPALLARELADGRWAGRLRVLNQANAGQGAARNRAIAEARGEYCSFLDSDDLMFPWSLAVAAEAVEAHGRPPVVYNFGRDLIKFETRAEYEAVRRKPTRLTVWRDLYHYGIAGGLMGPPGGLVARTEALRAIGGFLVDRVVGEDLDLLFRLGTCSPMVKIEAPQTWAYRVHPGQFTIDGDKWYCGACSLLRRFAAGVYPGGASRAAEVRALVAGAEIYFSVHCLLYLDGRGWWTCLKIYFRALAFQLRARQFNFVFWTPLRVALNLAGYWPRDAELRAKLRAERANRQRGISPAAQPAAAT